MKRPDTFVVLDTETGGFNPTTDSILSLGGVIIKKGVVQEQKFYTLICEEDIHANEGALKVNGLTIEQIKKEGLSPKLAVNMLARWMSNHGLTFDTVVIGANIGFDMGFIKRMFGQADQMKAFNKIFSHRTMDVQSIAAFLEQGMYLDLGGNSASLDNLCKLLHVDIDRAEAHNAAEDARATAHVYLALLDLLNIREG